MPARTFTAAPALSAAYTRPRQFTCAFLGDSITQGSHATYVAGDAFGDYITYASQGRLLMAGNFGVGGQRSDQIALRVQTALAGRPNYLAILAGTNDLGQGISLGRSDAQILDILKSNLRLMYRSAEALGTVPVAITIPPNNDSTNANRRQLLIIKANIWIRRHAFLKGYPLVDFYTLLVNDGVTLTPVGQYKAAYALDGTHPNAAGHNALAALFSQTILSSGVPMPFGAVDSLDTSRNIYLFNNPLFATSVNNAKIPDSFATYGASSSDAHTVYSMVTDSQVPGRMQQIAMDTSATNTGGITAGPNSGMAIPGDLIAIGGYYTTDGVSSTQIQLLLAGTTYKPLGSGAANNPVTRGFYYMEVPMPAAGNITVNLLPGLRTGFASTQAFGYPTVVNLTRTIGETTPLSAN